MEPRLERRALGTAELRLRATGATETRQIGGYAAVYDQLSEDLGGWRERIAPGAFAQVLRDDVRALFNHDPSLILGRTRAGTLRLADDDHGLSYEIDPPAGVPWVDGLLAAMSRGDVTGSSFQFIVDDDEWLLLPDGSAQRTIRRFRRLLDVSPVTFPAYPQADAAMRDHLAALRAGGGQAPAPVEPVAGAAGRSLASLRRRLDLRARG